MTLARTPWYPAYAGADALADQQLAGVVMWAYAGLAAVVGGTVVVVRWLGALDRRMPGLVAVTVPPGSPPC